jgi:adenylate cyclase
MMQQRGGQPTVSGRSRREWAITWRVLLASAILSACFAYFNRDSRDSPWHAMSEGIATSLVIATPLMLLELRGTRMAAYRRLRRLPLAVYFVIKVLFYAVVIVGGLLLMRFAFTPDLAYLGRFDTLFRRSLVFAIGMSIAFNLVVEMGGLLGFGTLRNLVTGRYVQPRHERRAFLLIDMRDSTGLAERLGPVRFHELLNHFFRDVADAALECEADIHKYVGDEAILTWADGPALADGDCLRCVFLAREFIARHSKTYQARFGAVPTFRAAIHYGEIVAGEIGDVRREIAYVGDTLNVTARLLEAAKQLGHDVLVSDDLLARAALPPGVRAQALPTLRVRGRAQPLGVSALVATA